MSALETQASPLVTAERFAELAESLGRCELIEGRIVAMAPGKGEHGLAGGRLNAAIVHHVVARDLGDTTLAETGFLVATDPDTVRAPDLAFVPANRVPDKVAGWLTVVPALVLEVVSPDARQADILHKVGTWLDYGVDVVWVLYLGRRCLVEYRAGDRVRHFGEHDTVTCDDILPGFAYPLARALAIVP